MSETTEPQGGATPPEPIVEQDNQVEANDNPKPDDQEHEQQSKTQRRIAQLSARLAAETRERERLQAEAEAWRQVRQQQGGEQAEETDDQRDLRLRQQLRGEVEAQVRREQFHAEGESAFGQAGWRQKCDDLISMGADPGFAQLIVEMPDRVKMTAALADDPEAVQRIAAIRTERGRAIALGKYSASLEARANGDDTPRQSVVPRVTAAPAPVRQVGGRAAPTFNPYNPNLTGEQLYDFFAKQDRDRRAGR